MRKRKIDKHLENINSAEKVSSVEKSQLPFKGRAVIAAENQYHATEQLMKMYRTIAWSIRGRADILVDPIQPTCAKQLDELLFYLSEFAPIYMRKEFENKVNEIFFTKWMLDLIDTAVMKVHSYPGKGKAYYDILYFTYMDEVRHTEWDILAYTGLERSNYYRKRKEALAVLSQVLWGMAMPEVKKLINTQQKNEEMHRDDEEKEE